MEGVHVVGAWPEGFGGCRSLSGAQGKRPGRGPEGRSPPEAEAKYEITVQLLTFYYRKFRI